MPGGGVLNVVWFLAGTTVTGVATAWKVAPILRRLSHLLDDLLGEPPRAGLPTVAMSVRAGRIRPTRR